MNEDTVNKAIENLGRNIGVQQQSYPISFEDFLALLTAHPKQVVRNVFQIFHDMVKTYVDEGPQEDSDRAAALPFTVYDCNRLFVEGADRPFFADLLFANRLMNHVEALKRGAQQNKIYIFDGPPGCGKSTFLNNLLMKFEEYAGTKEGMRFETVWRLDRSLSEATADYKRQPLFDQLWQLINHQRSSEGSAVEDLGAVNAHLLPSGIQQGPWCGTDGCIEIPCPSHDHPLMLIPKDHRRSFFDDLFKNDEFKWKLFSEKEYEWVFEDTPCTFCITLYEAMLQKLGSPAEVFKMVYAHPYRFIRRLSQGISVYNPGDPPMRQSVLTDVSLQQRINNVFGDGRHVPYFFSRYAKTNNGVYALMDIKSHNTKRLIELHNIISEGVHKVQDMEENVNSLFLAVMNPEDKKNVQHIPSFSDRIEYIHIPYVLDLKTEVAIYRDTFGQHIGNHFLPRILRNFARTIISARLNKRSEALLEWIGSPDKYSLYCDKNLQLLKIEIYMGRIPPWLSEEDRKRLTAKRRRRILAESETEGIKGFSGRDSIKIFNEFFSTFAREDKLIDMSALCRFFSKIRPDLKKKIPDGFLSSLRHLYDYKILQEVKESLYYYNEEQISRDIQNYIFALNFEPGAVVTNTYTGEKLDISEAFFWGIEKRLLDSPADDRRRQSLRKDTQKEYTTRTLTQEIMVEGKTISETRLYQALHERYVYNLKEKVLDPFLDNENFRRAVRDYDQESFKTYDQKIQDDVQFLISNLCQKFEYTHKGAREICMYVIDSDLAKTFAETAAPRAASN